MVLPLLETDLLEIADACVNGTLADVEIRWKNGAAVCVVLASKGYPEKVESGKSANAWRIAWRYGLFPCGDKNAK